MAQHDDSEQTCWICLEEGGDLVSVCDCPSCVHSQCLAKWQLHNIGKPEEINCRFCKKEFPDWKEKYKSSSPVTQQLKFKVLYQGKKKMIPIDPDNVEEFRETIRKTFNLPDEYEMTINYICKIPEDSTVITFSSDGATNHEFQSAAYLAAYTNRNSHGNIDDVGDTDDVVDYQRLGLWGRMKLLYQMLTQRESIE